MILPRRISRPPKDAMDKRMIADVAKVQHFD
jgi:hypothetical protein